MMWTKKMDGRTRERAPSGGENPAGRALQRRAPRERRGRGSAQTAREEACDRGLLRVLRRRARRLRCVSRTRQRARLSAFKARKERAARPGVRVRAVCERAAGAPGTCRLYRRSTQLLAFIFQMDKSLILLFWIQYVVKMSKSFHYIPISKQTTTIFVEWEEFPKGGSPEFYFLQYQLVNNLAQKDVKSIPADPLTPPNAAVTLEENEDYHIIIQSIKYGHVLSEKSFQTRGISTKNIRAIATSTSVSLNWSVLSSNDISVSISLNNSSQIMQNNITIYEWNDLKPATLYDFTLEFKQLHLDFINILQRINVQIETGSCSQGWVALKNNCYRISKESKPWNIAQQHCKLSLNSAYLVDIKNEEEKKFIFSHLRSKNQIILWTGLNDLKKEGHLTWTDGSSYGLNKNEVFSFALLPKNETDCYILQQNATGLNYFFTRFFCYVPLPYVCKYESPSLPENLLIHIKDVGTTEVVFSWNNLNGWNTLNKWLKLGYKITLKYYLDYTEQHFESIPPNTTEKSITQLSPGRVYRFSLFMINEWEARTTLSPVFLVETRINPPQKVYANPEDVGEDSIILQWEFPQDGHEVYIQIRSIPDAREVMNLFVKDAKRSKIDNLIPGMTYDIGMATVMNGNLSELTPDAGVFDGIHILIEGGPNVTMPLKHDNKITVANLTPGTEYNFSVSAVSGTKFSNAYHVPAVKTCLEAPSNIHEGNVTDSSIEILWNRAGGNFQHYEITCINSAAAFMVQKVVQEAATFWNLEPATVYTFSVRTEKEGFKDSAPDIKDIQTGTPV
ncbi:uncharacterized protein AAES06_005880 [Glossophaga mutica]